MVKTNKNRRAFGRLLACERDRNARCTRRNGRRKTTHEPFQALITGQLWSVQLFIGYVLLITLTGVKGQNVFLLMMLVEFVMPSIVY